MSETNDKDKRELIAKRLELLWYGSAGNKIKGTAISAALTTFGTPFLIQWYKDSLLVLDKREKQEFKRFLLDIVEYFRDTLKEAVDKDAQKIDVFPGTKFDDGLNQSLTSDKRPGAIKNLEIIIETLKKCE